MSISRDFERYYAGTWIGKRDENGAICPFYVESVSYNGPDGEHQYLPENLQHLVFHGSFFTKDGGQEEVGCNYTDAVLDNPEIGYVVIEGRPVWTFYRTAREMVKGVNMRRIGSDRNFRFHITANIMQQFFDREAMSTKVSDIHFYNNEGTILYKGMEIGTVRDGVVALEPQFHYLNNDANRIFGGG